MIARSVSVALFAASARALTLQRGHDLTEQERMDIDQVLAAKYENVDGEVPKEVTYISNPDTAVITENPVLETEQADIFLRYMPDEDVVMCGCGKCGSTSMLEYVYDQVFPERWSVKYEAAGPPFVQEVMSSRWESKFQMVNETKEQAKVMDKAFSFALIRDPKERYVSAWKSKLACDTELYGVDAYDRSHFAIHGGQYRGFVAQIQRLRGMDENITCMPLDMFAQALVDIKKLNRLQYLDRHFLPQDLGCFYKFGPEKWSKVTTISEDRAFDELASKLNTENTQVPDMHSSTSTVFVSKEIADALDEATEEEYAMLKPYLSKPSKVVAGANV